MREVKFRAWIKDKNQMEHCVDVNPFYVGDCDRFHWKHDEVELMQFTGLYDSTSWDQLTDKEKLNFYNRNRSEDGRTIKYQNVDDVKHLWHGKEIYEGDILMHNNNSEDLTRVCFGEFGVRNIETEEIIDNSVGWYLKVLKTDAMSEIAPFCYDRTLNEYWIKELSTAVITNIYEHPEIADAIPGEGVNQ